MKPVKGYWGGLQYRVDKLTVIKQSEDIGI